jgi:hypothetical protein
VYRAEEGWSEYRATLTWLWIESLRATHDTILAGTCATGVREKLSSISFYFSKPMTCKYITLSKYGTKKLNKQAQCQ